MAEPIPAAEMKLLLTDFVEHLKYLREEFVEMHDQLERATFLTYHVDADKRGQLEAVLHSNADFRWASEMAERVGVFQSAMHRKF